MQAYTFYVRLHVCPPVFLSVDYLKLDFSTLYLVNINKEFLLRTSNINPIRSSKASWQFLNLLLLVHNMAYIKKVIQNDRFAKRTQYMFYLNFPLYSCLCVVFCSLSSILSPFHPPPPTTNQTYLPLTL